MERDSIEATGSGKNFRSGQTRYHADRPRSTQARGMSVRFVDRLFIGYPPERTQTNTDHFTETARNRRNDTLAKSRYPPRRVCGLRATTSRWTSTMVSERTPHEECESTARSRERNRVIPAIPKVPPMATSNEATGLRPACAAPSQEDAARRGIRRIPEQSGRERTGTGHGTERVSPTHERSWTNNGWDERDCNGMQTRSDGDAGHHRSSVRPKGMT